MAAKKKTSAKKAAGTKRPAAGGGRSGARSGGRPAAKKGAGPARKGAVRTKRAAAKKPAAKKAIAPDLRAPEENPRAQALARRAADIIVDRKGTEVVILDVRGRTSYADYLVLASGESERHVSSLAEAVSVELKKENERALSTEGHTPGQWVLMDYGDVVVHLFASEARSFYDLEGVWPDVPRQPVKA